MTTNKNTADKIANLYAEIIETMRRLASGRSADNYTAEIIFRAGQIMGLSDDYEDHGLCSAVFSSLRFAGSPLNTGLLTAVETRYARYDKVRG